MSHKKDFNLFIGGKTGILKGVHLTNENILIKNLQSVKTLTACNEITSMAWGDANETDILIGTRDQTVRVYDSEFKGFSSCLNANSGKGAIVGVTRFEDVITTCSASGHIKCLKYSKDNGIEIDTKKPVEKMESAGLNSGIVATGGQANDIKIWDISTQSEIFAGKNVNKNDLDVAIPVWVTDMKFLPNSQYKVAVSSRYGHVRLYDTVAQRKPVVEMTLPDQSLQCLDLAHREHQVVVASGTGHILLLDLRVAGGSHSINSNQRVVSTFKGATGSVRQVACHKTQPYLASVGLDSYFRLHHLDTKQVLHQKFMQVKLNTVLMRDSLTLVEPEAEPALQSVITEPAPATEEMNYMFDSMDTIGGKKRRTSHTL